MPTTHVTPESEPLLQDIANALFKAKKVVVVTGAGISTNSGIPDFRSENGLYSLIQAQFDNASKELDRRKEEAERAIRSSPPILDVICVEERPAKRRRISQEGELCKDSQPSRRSARIRGEESTGLDEDQTEDEVAATNGEGSLSMAVTVAGGSPSATTGAAGDDAVMQDLSQAAGVPESGSPGRHGRSQGTAGVSDGLGTVPASQVWGAAMSRSEPSTPIGSPELLPRRPRRPENDIIAEGHRVIVPSIENLGGPTNSYSSPRNSTPRTSNLSSEFDNTSGLVLSSSPLSSPPPILSDPYERLSYEAGTRSLCQSSESSGSVTSSSSGQDSDEENQGSEESGATTPYLTSQSSFNSNSTSSRNSTTLPNLKGKDLFDVNVWSDPVKTSVFYTFATTLRQKARDVSPTTSHHFLGVLRDSCKLVRCYTQNIDRLEERVGLTTSLELGSGRRSRFSAKALRAREGQEDGQKGQGLLLAQPGGCNSQQEARCPGDIGPGSDHQPAAPLPSDPGNAGSQERDREEGRDRSRLSAGPENGRPLCVHGPGTPSQPAGVVLQGSRTCHAGHAQLLETHGSGSVSDHAPACTHPSDEPAGEQAHPGDAHEKLEASPPGSHLGDAVGRGEGSHQEQVGERQRRGLRGERLRGREPATAGTPTDGSRSASQTAIVPPSAADEPLSDCIVVRQSPGTDLTVADCPSSGPDPTAPGSNQACSDPAAQPGSGAPGGPEASVGPTDPAAQPSQAPASQQQPERGPAGAAAAAAAAAGPSHSTAPIRGVECVFLHGSLECLRCFVCARTTTWDDKELHTLAGNQPTCPHCAGATAAREERGKRALGVGKLRPDIVLYGEEHPQSHLISPIVQHDLSLGPDMLLILGTSMRVHGLKVLVKEFAKAVHSKGGKVVFVNFTKPPESVWADVIDFWVQLDCDAWVMDVKSRKPALWLPPGSAAAAVAEEEESKEAKAPKAKRTSSALSSSKVENEKAREKEKEEPVAKSKRKSAGGPSKARAQGSGVSPEQAKPEAVEPAAGGNNNDKAEEEGREDGAGADDTAAGIPRALKEAATKREPKLDWNAKRPAATREDKKCGAFLTFQILRDLERLTGTKRPAFALPVSLVAARRMKAQVATTPGPMVKLPKLPKLPKPKRARKSAPATISTTPIPLPKIPVPRTPVQLALPPTPRPSTLPPAGSSQTSITAAVKLNPRKRRRKMIDGVEVILPGEERRLRLAAAQNQPPPPPSAASAPPPPTPHSRPQPQQTILLPFPHPSVSPVSPSFVVPDVLPALNDPSSAAASSPPAGSPAKLQPLEPSPQSLGPRSSIGTASLSRTGVFNTDRPFFFADPLASRLAYPPSWTARPAYDNSSSQVMVHDRWDEEAARTLSLLQGGGGWR